jgi:hypothetical protein
MNSPQVIISYHIMTGNYPLTKLVHEAVTKHEAEAVRASLASKGETARVQAVHLVWLQNAWRKVNSGIHSDDPNRYPDFSEAKLRQPS